MFDRLASRAHRIGIFIEPRLNVLDDGLMLPPRNATLSSRRALTRDRACLARIGPITVKLLAALLSRKAIRQFLTRRAEIDILSRLIDKILLAKPPCRLRARCHRFRQRHRDAGVAARLDLLAVEVAAI